MDTRTDCHRPSAINPTDYDFVGIEHDRRGSGFDPGAIAIVAQMRARIQAHMDKTGGTYATHQHGGNCMVCGSVNCIYTVLWHHKPSNTYVRTGFECAGKLGQYDARLFRTYREACQEALQAKAGKVKAQGILVSKNLEACWAIYAAEDWSGYKFEESTIADIVGKLVKYGSISEAQERFLVKLLAQIPQRKEREARFAAERELAQDCPTGRQTVRGTVLKVEYRDSEEFGGAWKLTFKAEAGFILWGTLPRALVDNVQRGDVIELTATIRVSDKDPKFGFTSRPSGKLITPANVPATV